MAAGVWRPPTASRQASTDYGSIVWQRTAARLPASNCRSSASSCSPAPATPGGWSWCKATVCGTIARAHYGHGMHHTLIFGANKDQIRNPDLIYPGQVFSLPKAN